MPSEVVVLEMRKLKMKNWYYNMEEFLRISEKS